MILAGGPEAGVAHRGGVVVGGVSAAGMAVRERRLRRGGGKPNGRGAAGCGKGRPGGVVRQVAAGVKGGPAEVRFEAALSF